MATLDFSDRVVVEDCRHVQDGLRCKVYWALNIMPTAWGISNFGVIVTHVEMWNEQEPELESIKMENVRPENVVVEFMEDGEGLVLSSVQWDGKEFYLTFKANI